jgi:hypothetical protein
MARSPVAFEPHRASMRDLANQLMGAVAPTRARGYEFGQQMGLQRQGLADQRRAALAGEELQGRQMAQQAGQFGRQMTLAERQQAIQERTLDADLARQRWEQENAWMGPAAQILSLGLTPGGASSGFLLQWLPQLYRAIFQGGGAK